MNKLSVAIVSWNGREHLEQCLESLSGVRDPGIPWEILVHDNGSQDGTVEWVESHHPEVRLSRSESNLGFCGGNDRLLRSASGDWVVLLNNDTRVEPDWLGELVRAARDAAPEVAAISGRIVDWDAQRLDFGRGAMTFDGHAFQLDYRRPLAVADAPGEGEALLFPCGGNVLLRREAYLAVDGFDLDYFAYLEDVDLGWRLWSAGWEIIAAPRAVVRHRSMATSDLLGATNRGFLFERNAFLTVAKNYDAELRDAMMPAVLLTLISRNQTLLVENNPGGRLLTVDPFAGWIAGTAGADQPALRPEWSIPELRARWRQWGGREFLSRALRRVGRQLGLSRSSPAPVLCDERSLSQQRSVWHILRHLDRCAEKRAVIQERRRRSDAEIFERFPLYVVPTYPGDEALFASDGFRSWLPARPELTWRRLDEVMELGG